MLRVTLNGEPCLSCGHRVRCLVVDMHFRVGRKTYFGNQTLPCGCIHGPREQSSTVSPHELRTLVETNA